MQTEVLVIGAGPAGLIAAGRAASLGASVLVLEKNRSVGRKLAITGGGRCNIFNAQPDLHKLTQHFGSQGKKLFSILSDFGPRELSDFFEGLGLALKVEAENRVFPVSDRAQDVRDVLLSWAEEQGVRIRTQSIVRDMQQEGEGGYVAALADGSRVHAKLVILATGGTARPETGSTGDAFPWLEALGHRVLRPAPILVPIKIAQRWVSALMGIKLADAALSFEQDEPGAREPGAQQPGHGEPSAQQPAAQARTTRVRKRGKLLFTHFGLSGPLVLNASAEIEIAARSRQLLELSIDLVADKTREALEAWILAAQTATPKKSIAGILSELLPAPLAARVCQEAALDPKLRLAELPKAGRAALLAKLKGLTLNYTGQLGPEKAIVSRGGVDLEQVDFRSMESLFAPGLYLVGDLLDFDRPSGGFSLQICWSSGWRAGYSAATRARQR